MIKVRVQTVHTGNKGQDQECNGDLIRRYQPPPSYLISLSRIFQVVPYLISLSDTASRNISTGPPAPFLQYNVHPGHAKEKGRDGEVGLQVNIRRISRPLERHGPYGRAGPIYGTHSLMPHVPSHIPSCLYCHMLVVRPMKREVQRVPLILRSDCLVH